MDLGLKRRRAVVTGASRGIGRAIASALAAEGADVVAAARNAQKLKDLAASVAAETGSITAHAADMSQADAIQGLAGELEKADILVFNTGGPPFGTAAEITDASWTAQFEAMFLSAIRLTRLALPGMRQRRFGRIMLVVSSGVIQPIPNLALSNALRSGLVGWAKTLASEVAADGVTVNCLAPGRIATDRIVEFDEARARREGITVEQAQKAATATIPAGRYGEADEFAAMAAFLASPRASYMTGGIIRIDGGMIRSV
ncbi:MAG TPA: SDR family oxidoreductase [Steroidobacteraceae bacterium]|nr:SDR family oxidoreductase [Steroidobacteraceae bacterium]